MRTIYKIFLYGLLGLLLIAGLFGCWGGFTPVPKPEPSVPTPTTPPEIIYQTLRTTDWLVSILLIGATCGVFAGFNGLKVGYLAAGAAVVGLVLRMALSQMWVWWLAGIVVVVGVLILGITIFRKDKALKEIISGVQNFKNTAKDNPLSPVNAIRDYLREQSDSTKKIVTEIKEKL